MGAILSDILLSSISGHLTNPSMPSGKVSIASADLPSFMSAALSSVSSSSWNSPVVDVLMLLMRDFIESDRLCIISLILNLPCIISLFLSSLLTFTQKSPISVLKASTG